jgi:hypothetical protein
MADDSLANLELCHVAAELNNNTRHVCANDKGVFDLHVRHILHLKDH